MTKTGSVLCFWILIQQNEGQRIYIQTDAIKKKNLIFYYFQCGKQLSCLICFEEH